MAFYTTVFGYQLPTYLLIEIVKVETTNEVYISPRLTINEVETSKKVFIHSTIHQNKKVELGLCWSANFSDVQILNDGDLFALVCDMYELSLKIKLTSGGRRYE